MGKGEEHLRLSFTGFTAVGFGMAKRYKDEGKPQCLSLVGNLSVNSFRGVVTNQLILMDFKKEQNNL